MNRSGVFVFNLVLVFFFRFSSGLIVVFVQKIYQLVICEFGIGSSLVISFLVCFGYWDTMIFNRVKFGSCSGPVLC